MRRNLELVRGTSLSVDGVARDPDGTRIDLTDGTITWRIGSSDRTYTYATVTGTATDAANGEYSVSLSPSDTADLAEGYYLHEAELTESDGTVTVILSGVLHLKRDLS